MGYAPSAGRNHPSVTISAIVLLIPVKVSLLKNGTPGQK
jgi:hypothetical protein